MKNLQLLIKEYKKALNIKDEMQEKYNKVKNRVLRQGNYTDEDTQERILTCEDDYCMSKEQFEVYCKVLYIEQQTEGIYTKHWDDEPMAVYEENLRYAETMLIEYGIEYLMDNYRIYVGDLIENFSIRNNIHREKMINILLKYKDQEIEKEENIDDEYI